MTAIFRKELHQYFSSPLGYIYLGVFFLFAGFYFFATVLVNNSTDISYVYSGLFTICLFLIPLLTMRLFAEEKRNRTDQALLTAPVMLSGLVAGKYLSALFLFFLGNLETLLFAVIIDCFSQMEWAAAWGNFIGLMLLGAALCAIGTFLSSMTENQLIAAVSGMAVGLILMLVEGIADVLPDGTVRGLLIAISFKGHYQGFTEGMLSLADIVFFVSVTVFFLFLTVRRLDEKRWK